MEDLACGWNFSNDFKPQSGSQGLLYKVLYMCLKYDLFASLSLKKKKPFADQAIILFLAFTQYSPNMENHWNSSQQLVLVERSGCTRLL